MNERKGECTASWVESSIDSGGMYCYIKVMKVWWFCSDLIFFWRHWSPSTIGGKHTGRLNMIDPSPTWQWWIQSLVTAGESMDVHFWWFCSVLIFMRPFDELPLCSKFTRRSTYYLSFAGFGVRSPRVLARLQTRFVLSLKTTLPKHRMQTISIDREGSMTSS